jgi:hypothetical protein
MKNNIKTGIAYEMQNKNRLEALKVLQIAKELEELKKESYERKNT